MPGFGTINDGFKSYQLGEDADARLDVKLNATDNKVYKAGATDEAIGTLEKGGLNGDYVTVRLRNVPGTRKVTVASSCAQGARLYGAAGGKVDDVATGGAARYVALQAATGANSIIEVIPAEKNDLLMAEIADSTAVTTTSTETDFDQQKTINGAELVVGDVLEIFAQGIATATNSTDTLAPKLYVGALAIAAPAAVDVADNDVFTIHAFATVVAAGAGGKIRAGGYTAIGASGTGAAKEFRTAEAAVDLSGNVALKVSAKWSTTNAGNSCKLEQLVVKRHRQ